MRKSQKGDGHSQKWRVNNPDKNRQYYLKTTYNITVEEYDLLLKAQNNSCAICGGPPSVVGNNLHVDHNHTTGKNRGLLCGHCNLILGQSKENKDILRKSIEYLEKYE